MTPQRAPQHWGPTPARPSSSRARRWLSLAVFFGLLAMPNTPVVIVPVCTLIGLIVAYRLSTDVRDIRAWLATRHGASPVAGQTASLTSVRAQVARDGGGAVLGAPTGEPGACHAPSGPCSCSARRGRASPRG